MCSRRYHVATTARAHFIITGGSSGGGGGGVAGVATPPLIFQKKSGHPRGRCDRFTRVTVVIDLVVTSSNNACLCALNGGPF